MSVAYSCRTLKEQDARIDPDVVHEVLEDQQLFVHQVSMGISRQKFMMRLAKAHVNRILAAGEAIQSFFLVSAIIDVGFTNWLGFRDPENFISEMLALFFLLVVVVIQNRF